MANDYVDFSFSFKINSPAEAEFLDNILHAADNNDPDDELCLDIFGRDWQEDPGLGFDYKIDCDYDGGVVYLYTDSGEGNTEYAACLCLAYLEHFELNKTLGFAWAEHCSKPRIGAFGGGAVRINRFNGLEWFTTWKWLHDNDVEPSEG